MKTSETRVVDDTLEPPVRLTPEQLENVAAGFAAQLIKGNLLHPGATTGLFPPITGVNVEIPGIIAV
jgi:hypothetical protein